MDVFSKHQQHLPPLPLPDLEDTLSRYVATVAPMLTDAQLECTRAAVATSADALRALHFELARRRETAGRTSSYVKPFWDRMYLGGRYALPINSNPALLLRPDPRRVEQCARAASLVHAACAWHEALREGKLPADQMGGRPCCMDEYSRLLGASRVPHGETDRWRLPVHPVQHVVVMCQDVWFKLDLLTGAEVRSRPCSEAEIYAALQKIVVYGARQADHGAAGAISICSLGALTSLPRTEWSRWRDAMVVEKCNKKLLDIVDGALLMVALENGPAKHDDDAVAGPYRSETRSQPSYSDRVAAILHGGDSSGRIDKQSLPPRWWDKLLLIVWSDGTAALNFEHSLVDGQTVSRFALDVWRAAVNTLPPSQAMVLAAAPDATLMLQRLTCARTSDLDAAMLKAINRYTQSAGITRIVAARFSDFGKRKIKRWGQSPDAFLQLGFQLAYYRLHLRPGVDVCEGRTVFPFSVYESVSTKAFRFGRTEALRSITPESVTFCVNMSAGALATEQGRNRARHLLTQASNMHRKRAKEAGNGLGVDRHLFSLLNIAAEMPDTGIPPLFQDAAWSLLNTSVLSTSCVNGPHIDNIVFGAVCPKGYGIGYVVKDDWLDFSVSNFVCDPDTEGAGFGGVRRADDQDDGDKSTGTDSAAFVRELEQAFRDMRVVCSSAHTSSASCTSKL